MVDSIKNSQSLLSSSTAPKKASEASKQNAPSALRESFKTLSSGTSVSQVANEASAVVNVRKREEPAKGSKLVESLNEAVRFSNEALNVLEQVAESDSDEKGSGLVREFADDLEELKSDIVDLLSDLRSRAETADVASENLEAADATVEDVDRAQNTASEASDQIQFNSDEALGAIGELNFERVAKLLAE